MALIKCVRGHYYEESKYRSCPYCEMGAKPAGRMAGSVEEDRTVCSEALDSDERTLGYDELSENERTIGAAFSESGSLVTGWLVCTAGAERGRDYRLHEGRNYVGRSLVSDIVVADVEMARENHFSIAYDGKNNEFLIVPGKGTLTYVDGHALTQPECLQDDASIRAGKSRFMFRSFCRKKVRWDEMDKEV